MPARGDNMVVWDDADSLDCPTPHSLTVSLDQVVWTVTLVGCFHPSGRPLPCSTLHIVTTFVLSPTLPHPPPLPPPMNTLCLDPHCPLSRHTHWLH